jgi:hypothetical protein
MYLSTRAASSSGDSSGPRLLVEAEEVDDLLGALAEGELVAARQHRHRTRAHALQLAEAVRVFKDIH